MPWLDTGIESGIGRLQICPGWIQVSNLSTLHADMPWLDTGIESTIGCSQIFHGLLQVLIWNSSDMPWLETGIESGDVIVDRCALAGDRNRIFELFRRALARYRNRVWKRGC